MLTRSEALDRYYLDVRCQLVEIAATLDRIDRGDGGSDPTDDPRLSQLREAVALLAGSLDGQPPQDDAGRPNRSERMLLHFSDLASLD